MLSASVFIRLSLVRYSSKVEICNHGVDCLFCSYALCCRFTAWLSLEGVFNSYNLMNLMLLFQDFIFSS